MGVKLLAWSSQERCSMRTMYRIYVKKILWGLHGKLRCRRGGDDIKMDLDKIGCEPNVSGSGLGPVLHSCEHFKRLFGSIKAWNFLFDGLLHGVSYIWMLPFGYFIKVMWDCILWIFWLWNQDLFMFLVFASGVLFDYGSFIVLVGWLRYSRQLLMLIWYVLAPLLSYTWQQYLCLILTDIVCCLKL